MKPRFLFRFIFITMLFLTIPIQHIVMADDNLQQSTFASPIVVVNTSFLNIRTGPSASYSILATVPGGTELPVIGVYEDGVWYQVATNLGLGWVNVEFTLARGDFSRVPLVEFGTFAPVTSTSVPVAILGQGGGVVTTPLSSGAIGLTGVSFEGGDLRTGPGSSAPLVAAIVPADNNSVFPIGAVVQAEGRPYYQVNFPGYGIVWSDRFRLRPLRCGGPEVVVALERVGTAPVGVSQPIEFQIGDEMFIAGPGRDGLIEIVTSDGTRGLVPVDKVGNVPSDIVYYCDGVTASSGFAGSNPVVATTATTNVVTPANVGQGGGVAPMRAAAHVVVNTGNLNIRTGPSASFSIVATVSGGTELAVLGVADDGVWYLVEGTFGRGWLNNEFVIFRGDYSVVPVLNINP